MFVNDNITVNNSASTSYGLDKHFVKPCHRVLKVSIECS